MENSKNILIIGDMPGYGKMGLAGILPIFPAGEKLPFCQIGDDNVRHANEAAHIVHCLLGRAVVQLASVPHNGVSDHQKALFPGREEETGRHVVWGFDGRTGEYFTVPYRFIKAHFPGTGDVFTSLLTGQLLGGRCAPAAPPPPPWCR